MIYIYVLIIFLIIVISVIRRLGAFQILLPPLWLIISYSFLIITHIFSGYTYSAGSTWNILPYVILCLIMLLIGFYAGFNLDAKILKNLFSIHLKTLAYVSIIGAFIACWDLFRLNTIRLGMRIEDQQMSIIGVAGTCLAGFGIVVWLYSLYLFLVRFKSFTLYSYLSLFSFISVGVLSGGRQAIFLILLSSFVMYIWGSKIRSSVLRKNILLKRKFPWGIICVVVLFFVYFFIISSVRSQIFNIDNKISMFEEFTNSKVRPEMVELLHNMGPMADIYMEGTAYYSQELPRLDILFQDYDFPPLMGLGQFLYISRRLEWLIGDICEQSWSEQERAIEQKNGFNVHSWGTFLTNYIVDFGRIGAVLACLVTGLILGVVSCKIKYSKDPTLIVRQCLICAGVIFSIQFSPFAEMTWFFSLMLVSFIGIIPPKESKNNYIHSI